MLAFEVYGKREVCDPQLSPFLKLPLSVRLRLIHFSRICTRRTLTLRPWGSFYPKFQILWLLAWILLTTRIHRDFLIGQGIVRKVTLSTILESYVITLKLVSVSLRNCQPLQSMFRRKRKAPIRFGCWRAWIKMMKYGFLKDIKAGIQWKRIKIPRSCWSFGMEQRRRLRVWKEEPLCRMAKGGYIDKSWASYINISFHL